MPDRISLTGNAVDLSRRIQETHTVVGSPATNAETIVASLTITDDLIVARGVFIEASIAYTVGTSGVSGTLKIRQTNTSGSTIATSGAVTIVATNLRNDTIQGVDPSPVLPGQIYVVTLQIGSGAATSTVSAVSMFCTIV
jgi:hypothetical protein